MLLIIFLVSVVKKKKKKKKKKIEKVGGKIERKKVSIQSMFGGIMKQVLRTIDLLLFLLRGN